MSDNDDRLTSPLSAFLEAEDMAEVMATVRDAPGELLTDAALTEIDRLLAAESVPDRRSRLIDRRELLVHLRAMRAQFDSLPEDERLFQAFMNVPNSLGMAAWVLATQAEALDTLEQTAVIRQANAAGRTAADIAARLDGLRQARAEGPEALRTLLDAAHAAATRLAPSLMQWMETPDWDTSEAYLGEHASELVTSDGQSAMDVLLLANGQAEQLVTHVHLLRVCREKGVEAAYVQLRQEMSQSVAAERQVVENPVLSAVVEFLRAEDDALAQEILDSRGTLLLTADGRHYIEGYLNAAREAGDTQAASAIALRVAMWQTAWNRSVGGPLRTPRAEPQQEVDAPESWQDQPDHRAFAADRSAVYRVVNARNCAIGDNASVLNIYDVGELALAWSYPRETRSALESRAVGRKLELNALRERLRHGNAALVGVRGLAGVGKTMLAAMYATRYADDYTGGVIWLNVGPGRRSQAEATPLIQQLATYAYNRDVRTVWLDDIAFAPDVVRMLLGGHGKLLCVFDDVWTVDVAEQLLAAVPDDATVLVTTRDRRVAYSLGDGPDTVHELDVLTPDDASDLLMKLAPGLPQDLANAVAMGLGRHAQALRLAGRALHRRKAHRYAESAEEILRRVAGGRGFGYLPDLDQRDAQTDVEIALKYSYDYLGENHEHGLQWQACLGGLGTFAQEATFDTAAAATVWGMTAPEATEVLLLFDDLALIDEQTDGDRWQQHAILRSYALSLQSAEVRLSNYTRYSDHYVDLAATCHNAKPRDYDRIAQEFPQIQHAFAWCRYYSPRRALRLTEILSDFMRNRGYTSELGDWLRIGLTAAEAVGSSTGKANTLKSLGDLESRLGNIAAARAHYDAALPLYEAEQARLGKANTLKSLGDLERRLGNIAAARAHYDAALPLYEAEQARLGKANTLQSLGDLERRLGNIAAARAHYDAALPLYEAEQDRLGKANTYASTARAMLAQGDWQGALDAYERALKLADQTEFVDHPAVQSMRGEYEALRATSAIGGDMQSLATTRAVLPLLNDWLRTPDWAASKAYIEDHAADMLTDVVATAMDASAASNPNAEILRTHATLLRRCREIGIAAAYAELGSLVEDPVGRALAALVRVDSTDALAKLVANEPALGELRAIEHVAGMVLRAQAAGSGPAARQMLYFAIVLADQYLRRHAEEVNPTEVESFILTVELLIGLSEEIEERDMGAELHRIAGHACNALGNHLTDRAKDNPSAIAAYTRGLAFDPSNAMLLRNRAGVHLEQGDCETGAADIDAAAALEPKAPRLAELEEELSKCREQGQRQPTEDDSC